MNFLSKFNVFLISAMSIATLTGALTQSKALTENEIKEIARQINVVIGTPSPRPEKRGEIIKVGSGVIIPSPEPNTYYALTSKHVASSGNKYTVITPDGIEHEIAPDHVRELSDIDLSWMKFTSSNDYQVAELGDSSKLESGDLIYIYGWPFHKYSPTWAPGKLRHNNLQNQGDGYEISYEAATENGMSGGPILDKNGRLVGIHGRDNRFYKTGIPINKFLSNATSGITWLRICNKYKAQKTQIKLAFAKYIWPRELQVKGWYIIEPDFCKTLAIGENYKQKIYYYAYARVSKDIRWGKGPKKFCVDMTKKNFTIPQRESSDNSSENSGIDICNGSNEKRVSMNELQIAPGMKSQNLID